MVSTTVRHADRAATARGVVRRMDRRYPITTSFEAYPSSGVDSAAFVIILLGGSTCSSALYSAILSLSGAVWH